MQNIIFLMFPVVYNETTGMKWVNYRKLTCKLLEAVTPRCSKKKAVLKIFLKSNGCLF